jgi:hypothetical protein
MNDSDKKFLLTVKILSYLLPGLSLAIVPLFFYEPNLSLLGSYLAFPMFLAPILYIKYHKKYISSSSKIDIDYGQARGYLFLILIILYLLFFAISIILLRIYDIRPLLYYVIITFMYTVIMFEILSFEISYKRKMVILIQIMMLSLNIVWSVTLKYYYFIERTDVLAHTWYITNLLNQGYVTYIFDLYQKFPLWHILVGSFYIIANTSIYVYKIMFFINGLNFAVLILVIYLISLKIFKDIKLGLISALITATNPEIVFYGMVSIPRSIEGFFEVILILLLLENDSRKKFLIIILTFVMVMYHTISIPFIMVILLLIYILQKLYNIEDENRFVNMNYILLAAVANLAYLIYYADNIFGIIIRNIVSPAVTGDITKSIVYTPLNEFFNYLQFLPLLFFVIIGALWILESKRFSGLEKIFGMTGLLLVAVAFPGPVLLLNKLAANFDFERFILYSLLIIVIIGAAGFMWMYNKRKKSLRIFAIILFILMGFLSISNDFNASDNPLVKRVYYTFYLNEEEVVAFNNIANVTNGYVLSDYVTMRYLYFSEYRNESHYLEVYPTSMMFLRHNNSDVILIRNQELNKRPLRFFVSVDGKFKLDPNVKGAVDYYYRDSPLWNSLEKYNKVYDSGGVNGFN